MSWWLRLPVHESGSIAKMLPDFVFIAPSKPLRGKKYGPQSRRDAKKRRRKRTNVSAIYHLALFSI